LEVAAGESKKNAKNEEKPSSSSTAPNSTASNSSDEDASDEDFIGPPVPQELSQQTSSADKMKTSKPSKKESSDEDDGDEGSDVSDDEPEVGFFMREGPPRRVT